MFAPHCSSVTKTISATNKSFSLPAICGMVLTAFMLSGCASAKFSALEKFGIHKRDLLVGDVEDTRDSQQEAHSVDAAEDVSDNIDDVEEVADALFEEWRGEIEQYTNTNLKSSSQQKLRETEGRYSEMLRSMRAAEQSMQPVLGTTCSFSNTI